MPTSNDPQVHTPHLQQPQKAGDIETFPGGQVSYLAPLPLAAWRKQAAPAQRAKREAELAAQ